MQNAIEDIASSENRDKVDFVVIPPPADLQTDEAEVDDNYIQEGIYFFPQHVAGEIELQYIGSSDGETSDDEYNLPLSVVQQNIMSSKETQKVKKKKLYVPKWTKDFVNTSMHSGAADRLEIMKSKLQNLTPVEVFEKLFGSVFDHLVQQTNLYSSQKNRHDFFVSDADMKLFIGILLFTGYHRPSERHYYNNNNNIFICPTDCSK
ncbi:transposase is4 [Holotrichia oblita]|uniref:Transposase is4 n=1 Tax=Holotrichia oblita TaxID=644536 RepID=A0ACB9TY39_HOLOL|nr:transposase is4 [Holotrichia oblita]